jgi:hypothetical protein
MNKKPGILERRRHAIFMRRTAASYLYHKKLAAAAGAELDYTLEVLRQWVEEAKRCTWCDEKLSARTFAVDHRMPMSRGGSLSERNLSIVCGRCNRRKGSLTDYEFAELQNLVMRWPAEAQKDIWMRLAIGGSAVPWRGKNGKGE